MTTKLQLYHLPLYSHYSQHYPHHHHLQHNRNLIEKIERNYRESAMISPFRSCFKLILILMGLFLFIMFMTSCRWYGQSTLQVDTWTDRQGVVHVQLTEIHGNNRRPGRVDVTGRNTLGTSPGSDKYDTTYITNSRNSGKRHSGNILHLEELDGTVEYTTKTKTSNGRPFYKVSGVKDEDLLRTLKEIEEERRLAKEEEIVMNIKEPDIDHRNVQVYDVTKDIDEEFQCINIHVRPFTPICVFDPKEDVFVSGTLTRGDVWEQHIVRRFQKVLQLHPDICVIDIGANIGQYSLIAANMGHKVVAVEPYLPSLKRFHKAIIKGDLSDKIKVLQNAVSDKREVVNIMANVDNQGDARVYHQFDEMCTPDSCQKVNTIHMNDLIPLIESEECVLKLDIQGYEHRAFVHAQLLLDKISIPYIFMEWSLMREFYITEANESEDKEMVKGMINVLVDNGYSVYSLVSGRKLNVDFWHGWAEDVLWIQEEKVSVENIEL